MKRKLFILSVALGLLYDFLFWGGNQGISFFIFILAFLIFISSIFRELNPTKGKVGFLFLVPISFFSVMSFVFTEPFVSFLNRAIALLLIGVWAVGYMSENWIRFSVMDYLQSGLRLTFNLISFPWLRLGSLGFFPTQKEQRISKALPFFRGLALAFPILLIFSFFFAAADLVFADTLNNFLSSFDAEHLGEFIQRVLMVFVVANFFLGFIVFTNSDRNKTLIVDENKPLLNPFLGTIESGVVLSCVLLLFASFIFLQFKYLFFNQRAITELGFTFAEYARRGFGELIAVTVVNIAVILGLSTITKIRTQKAKQKLSWLYTGLVLANIFILISALTRLNLYETAFGYSRLRMYSHVFILWLGILLLAICALIWIRSLNQFGNVFILFIIGFIATLNLINTDAQIVNRNILRALRDEPLDNAYLGSLSSDAVPALVNYFQDNTITDSIRTDLGATILCFQINNEKQLINDSWQSFTISGNRARKFLDRITSDLDDFETIKKDGNAIVIDEYGNDTNCSRNEFFD
jgi:hypothetical protein